MTDNVNKNLVPSSLHLSYVLSITIPQPTLRIRVPKVLAKAMQRRNTRLIRSSTQDKDEIGGSNDKKKKKSVACRKSLRKKVGAMFSSVFGNKKTSSSTDQTDENSEVEDDEVDKDVETLVVDTKEPVMRRTRNRVHNNYSNGVVQESAVATGFGVSKTLLVKKEISEAGDEGKEGVQEQGSIVSKSLSRRTTYGVKKANINKANDDTIGNGNNNSLSIVLSGKVPSVTSSSRSRKGAFKAAWSMTKLMGKESGKQQLCNKRILMGGKCKPLGTIQHDENGVLLPEIILD